MSDAPNFMTHERVMTGEEYVSYSDYLLLQRERNEARNKYDNLATEHMLVVNKLCKERDEAREDLEFRRELYKVQEEYLDASRKELDEARDQVKELIYIAGRAIDLAEIDYENDKFGVVSELRNDLEKIKNQND